MQSIESTSRHTAIPSQGSVLGREEAGRQDTRVGLQASSIRLPSDLGVAASRRLEGQPQANLSPLATGRPQSAEEDQEKEEFGPQRQQLCPSQGEVYRSRVVLGLRSRSHDRWATIEMAGHQRRVHAGMPGPGGRPRHDGRRGGRRACQFVPYSRRAENGHEFIAEAIKEYTKRTDVETLYVEPGSPWENGYAESFFSRFRDELLNCEEFSNLAEARWFARCHKKEHNEERPHSSLGYQTPREFAASCTATSAPAAPQHSRSPEETTETITQPVLS